MKKKNEKKEEKEESKERHIPYKLRMWKIGTNQWHGKYSFCLSDTNTAERSREEPRRSGAGRTDHGQRLRAWLFVNAK